RQHPLAQNISTLGESALTAHVLALSLCCFDGNWDDIPVGKVVRCRLHIEKADIAGQLKRVEQQLAGDEWTQLHRPFVQVHSRMQTSRLFTVWLAGAVEKLIARCGIRREEAERVEMRALQVMPLDDSIGARLP